MASVAKILKNYLYEWHEILAHQNFDYVKKVLKKNNTEIKQTSVPHGELFEGKDTPVTLSRVTLRFWRLLLKNRLSPEEWEDLLKTANLLK